MTRNYFIGEYYDEWTDFGNGRFGRIKPISSEFKIVSGVPYVYSTYETRGFVVSTGRLLGDKLPFTVPANCIAIILSIIGASGAIYLNGRKIFDVYWTGSFVDYRIVGVKEGDVISGQLQFSPGGAVVIYEGIVQGFTINATIIFHSAKDSRYLFGEYWTEYTRIGIPFSISPATHQLNISLDTYVYLRDLRFWIVANNIDFIFPLSTPKYHMYGIKHLSYTETPGQVTRKIEITSFGTETAANVPIKLVNPTNQNIYEVRLLPTNTQSTITLNTKFNVDFYGANLSRSSFQTPQGTYEIGAYYLKHPYDSVMRFECTSLSTSKDIVVIDEEYEVYADVKNSGIVQGTARVTFLVNDQIIDSIAIVINAGETKKITKKLKHSAVGTYKVCVDVATVY